MDLTLLENADLGDLTLAAGSYYCDDTCTGFPPGQQSGKFILTKYTNTNNRVIFIKQEFEGLERYGDRVLAKYERFAYPTEQIVAGDSFETKWFKLDPTAYKLAQPQASRIGGRP